MNDGPTMRSGFRKRNLTWLAWLVAAVVIASMFWNQGKVYTTASRKLGPAPVTDAQRVSFEMKDSQSPLKYRIRAKLQEGLVHIRLIGPSDRIIVDASGGTFTLAGPEVDEQFASGQYRIEIQSKQAVGTWSVIVHDKNYSPRMGSPALITGKLMTLVGVLAVWGWKRRSGVPWHYFGIGAAIWAVGVGLKFGWALPLNAPILEMINNSLPGNLAFLASAIYIGLLTGVSEIGVTIAAARLWPRLSQRAEQSIAIGIGAGAVEAVSLGALLSFSSVFNPEATIAGTFSLSLLLPVVERIVAILCHTAARVLVFFAAATHRWRWAVGGFLFLTGVDTAAAAFLLSNERTTLNPWLLELTLAPFALVSAIVLGIVAKRWPRASGDCESVSLSGTA